MLIALGNFTETGGHDAHAGPARAGPELTAVFAANDLSAIGAINAIAASGRSVPGDVSVVGFDDLRLARVHVAAADDDPPAGGRDRAPLDRAAARLSRGRKPGKLHHLFAPELIVRG